MLYYLYEMNHAAVAPWRAAADFGRACLKAPANPLAETLLGRTLAAGLDLFERVTRRYEKPEFGIQQTWINGIRVPVEQTVEWRKPFCRLLHFAKPTERRARRRLEPKLLIVAPMSGHHATLLRGTVETMLPACDVYITDWTDARMVPVTQGGFDLDDYIDYVIEMLRHLGPETHVMAVCQPSVPVVAAVSLMAGAKDPCTPASMTLIGGPIDTRRNPTAVNILTRQRGTAWFRSNAIVPVPFPNPGFTREVFPGFLQLSGFMTMNLDRHIDAHKNLFMHLVQGDGESADKQREFYDVYMSVMDLSAEFYLQTLDTVFMEHRLPKGEMRHRGNPVDPRAIRRTALMTVEGENDDILGTGQTEAAHELCENIPTRKRAHHLQCGVGHFGVFNGSRFRAETAPRVIEFLRTHAR